MKDREHEILGYKVIIKDDKLGIFQPVMDKFGNRYYEEAYTEGGFKLDDQEPDKIISSSSYPTSGIYSSVALGYSSLYGSITGSTIPIISSGKKSFDRTEFIKQLVAAYVKLQFDRRMDESVKMSKKEFDLGSYLKKEEVEEVIYKPTQYVTMPEPFQKATGLKGLPLGYSSMMYGLSDSGKTDILLKIAQEAVKQGILPKLIITENKLDESRLTEHGLIPKENCIIEEGLTTLEDVFDDISITVEDVKKGKLGMDVIILWDSVAGTPSKESFEIDKDGRISKKYGPQKNAQVIGYFNPIIAKRIASTREMLCDHSVGLVMLNQAYVKPPDFPGAMASIVPNGGEKIWFPLSLSIEIKEGQRIKTSINGQNREIALISKLKIKKNHITGQYIDGEIILSGSEMYENDKSVVERLKEEYKAKLKE